MLRGPAAMVWALALSAVACKDTAPARVPALSVAPGDAPVARLNTTQYTHAVEDLVGLTPAPALGFPADHVVDGFDTNVGNASLSQLRADALYDAAEGLAATLVEDLDGLLDCPTINDPCIDRFIADQGRMIYRRSLTSDEITTLRALYDSEPDDPVEDRLEQVLTAMFFAPQFLYRPEGGPDPQPTLQRLTGHEIATRMSFLLWASTPDAALLDAADAGELDTTEGIERQARRMLGDDRAVRGLRVFLRGLADVRDLDLTARDATHYPDFDAELAAAMEQELDHFFDRVIWEQNGGVAEILTSRDTHIDDRLADVYGVAHPGNGAWIDTTLPSHQRTGLLTLAAFLTDNAHSIAPAPVQRGKYVRNMLLCQDIPAPPDDVDTSPPEPSETTTNRERSEQHQADPACSVCHAYMDPIGLGFEHYDAIGRWRDTDNGQPVDATGELVHTLDVDGHFDGALHLSQILAHSEEVRMCMSEQVFRYAYGRRPTATDGGLSQIDARSHQTGGAITELLIGALLSDGFRFRQIEETH